MSDKNESKPLADFEVFAASAAAAIKAIGQLLVEKGVTTQKDLTDRIQKEQARIRCMKDCILNTAAKNPAQAKDIVQHPIAYSKQLPGKINLVDHNLVFTKHGKICESCVFQSVIETKEGVKDSCDLPGFLKNPIDKPDVQKLKGINPNCWFSIIGDKIDYALKEKIIKPEQVPEQIMKAVKRIITAMKQCISEDGIDNIINCSVVVENMKGTNIDLFLDTARKNSESESKCVVDNIHWAG